MKFSILLPTRNRLELLAYAIETVRRQDYKNWEIIVSDNDSQQDIAEYVASLTDTRIKYFRTKSFIPVTDNWNNALEQSNGDYVIMLGDDDCLLKGCLSCLANLVNEFDSPECIYTKALLYAYPGVMPNDPDGFLQPYDYASFFRNTNKPFWLTRHESTHLAEQAANFKMPYTFNMQHSIISRNYIKRAQRKGPFFQSPYPDFYATNAMMLDAEKVLVCPYPLVVVGISPKSFGNYYFNDKEDLGIEFLNNTPVGDMYKDLLNIVLPGSRDRTSWLFSMASIKVNYGKEYSKFAINFFRYRYLQVLYVLIKYYQKKTNETSVENDLHSLLEKLTILELVLVVPAIKVLCHLPGPIKHRIIRKLHATPGLDTQRCRLKFKNIVEVFEAIDPLDYKATF